MLGVVLASILPTVLYIVIVWRLDRLEKEPLGLLSVVFLWGAVPAGLIALLLETGVEQPMAVLFGVGAEVAQMVLLAPLVEESVKALAVWGVYRLARYEFDGILDGVVYGAMVGCGFGMTENLLYFASAADQTLDYRTLLFLGRVVAFGLNHALFTALTGLGFGLAKEARTKTKKILAVGVGFLGAIVAHMAHNLLVTSGACLISVLVNWAGLAGLVGVVALAWRRESEWLRTYLLEEVESGVISQRTYNLLTSRGEKYRQLWANLTQGNHREAKALRELQNVAVELAFHKRQLARNQGADEKLERQIAALRSRVIQLAMRRSEGG